MVLRLYVLSIFFESPSAICFHYVAALLGEPYRSLWVEMDPSKISATSMVPRLGTLPPSVIIFHQYPPVL